MFQQIASRFKLEWHLWLDKRSGVKVSHKLHRKNLYIFPAAAGWIFLLLALIIWLLGTNYQNNLILALAYLQFSVLVVAILQTYNNLSGLEVECLGSPGGHVGDSIAFQIRATSANSFGSRELIIGWRDGETALYDVNGGGQNILSVAVVVTRRGRFQPPKLFIRSDFPMGLVRCWTWLRFNTEVIVYPKAIECPFPAGVNKDGDDMAQGKLVSGGDEFAGYQQYRAGHSLKQIAWKQYARERGLHSKVYASLEAQSDDLNWSDFFVGNIELAISQMTYWALTLHRDNRSFSLTLPSAVIATGSGEAHLASCLKALALHGEAPSLQGGR